MFNTYHFYSGFFVLCFFLFSKFKSCTLNNADIAIFSATLVNELSSIIKLQHVKWQEARRNVMPPF